MTPENVNEATGAGEELRSSSEQRLARRADDTKTVNEERRWWEIDYRHRTKAPDWFRYAHTSHRADVDRAVAYWTSRECDVRVTEVVEVVTRTTTRGEPVTSSPSEKLIDDAP